jgi:hypothetical protein
MISVVLTAFANLESRKRSVECCIGTGDGSAALLANRASSLSMMESRRRFESASETGRRKSFQNSWSPSALQTTQKNFEKKWNSYNIANNTKQHRSIPSNFNQI